MSSYGFEVGDELRPGQVEGRPLAGEIVLNDPLPERLADDRSGIARADDARDLLDVLGRGARDDPVDHRARKGDIGLDPARQRRRPQSREFAHRRPEPRAVGRDIVAADQRQRRSAGLSPPLEGHRQQPEQRLRRERALHVRAQGGVVEIERAGRRSQAIALLGHRHRHDGNRRSGERRPRRPPHSPHPRRRPPGAARR